MGKAISTTIALLGISMAYLGVHRFTDMKKEQARILENTPKVSIVLSLEKTLDSSEFRGQSSLKILQKVFSDSGSEQNYRNTVSLYNRLIADFETKSAVDSYKTCETEVGYCGLGFGLGIVIAGFGMCDSLKIRKRKNQ